MINLLNIVVNLWIMALEIYSVLLCQVFQRLTACASFWQEFNAKLSDFGLAKAGPVGDNSHVSTQVLGTQGYAAPEYIATGYIVCPTYEIFVYHSI